MAIISFLTQTPLLLLTPILLFILLLRTHRHNNLHTLPGPLLASLTNLYRLLTTLTWHAPQHIHHLHQTHGPLLRYGPRMVSISHPSAIPTIYSFANPLPKSPYYPVQATISHGKPVASMFNVIDSSEHASFRKPIAHAYSMSALMDYEPLVDSTTTFLLSRLEEEFVQKREGICDLGSWLRFYAFDVIGSMTFSARFGFLQHGADVSGVLRQIEKQIDYSIVVGQMPWVDRLLGKNPLLMRISRPSSYIVRFAQERMRERLAQEKGGKEEKEGEGGTRRDFLSKFIAAQGKNPEQVPHSHILSWATSNMFAGADTVASSLVSAFYFLLKHPRCLNILLSEISSSHLSRPGPISWADTQNMPYLDAAIREAMRLQPAVGQIFERVVPDGGREICGRFFAAGTIVAVPAWTVHRDVEVYGSDAEVFRPERWLEADVERRRMMERTFIGFGAGPRGCVGINIGRLEVYKLVPEMLRMFEMQLAHPEREWKTHASAFYRQEGVLVKLRRRQ